MFVHEECVDVDGMHGPFVILCITVITAHLELPGGNAHHSFGFGNFRYDFFLATGIPIRYDFFLATGISISYDFFLATGISIPAAIIGCPPR